MSAEPLREPPAGAATQRERILALMRDRHGVGPIDVALDELIEQLGLPWHAKRILRWALATGKPVHQDDWWLAGPDGHGPCKHVRSRIPDLEREGFKFHHRRRDDGTVEYVFAEYVPPATEAPAEPTQNDQGGQQLALELPPTPVPAPLNAVLADWEAA